MKKLITVLMSLCLFALCVTPISVSASEEQPVNNTDVIVDTLAGQVTESYVIDAEGNVLGTLSQEVASVEVVYDGAWFNTRAARAANVPRIINVSVICKGTGVFANSMYNCTLNVALELKYNSSTMKITSVGTPDVYSYTAPGAPQNSSNPRATASITNSGMSVTIYGYITYSAVYTQTFTGSTKYYL